jgi:predicted NAD/FAD-binding protein
MTVLPGDNARPAQIAPLNLAVVGQGISGMSAAWLLSQGHRVTVYESEDRLGGHSHTVEAPSAHGPLPVDMGFIVYNEPAYPNLTALFKHLGVTTKASDMSFSVSLDNGGLEYGGANLKSWFAQPKNILSGRFWSMLGDLYRFYRNAPGHAEALDSSGASLGDYLDAHGYGDAFQDDHLLPQAAAIWSASVEAIRQLPAAGFIRFCQNHGLLKIIGRPIWRTVDGGSRGYVAKITSAYGEHIRLNCAVRHIRRLPDGVRVTDGEGRTQMFDHVVIAAHADQALAMLDDPSADESRLLGAFRYTRNHAVLHSDAGLMPRRRSIWSSWNYLGKAVADGGGRQLCVTYWMNKLQGLPESTPLFMTLNPIRPPKAGTLIRTEMFEHPLFDGAAMTAQKALWTLQGANRTWFCGSYFGAGFHEDGCQAGLAVAEQLGGLRRPWTVMGESARIHLPPTPSAVAA